MDAEMVKWFATMGVGGSLAAMSLVMLWRQQSEHKSEYKALMDKHSESLLKVNERLEHIINTSKQERIAAQDALIATIKESAAAHKDVAAVIAGHQGVLHDLRDVLRDLKR